jgi:hypothetical protein
VHARGPPRQPAPPRNNTALARAPPAGRAASREGPMRCRLLFSLLLSLAHTPGAALSSHAAPVAETTVARSRREHSHRPVSGRRRLATRAQLLVSRLHRCRVCLSSACLHNGTPEPNRTRWSGRRRPQLGSRSHTGLPMSALAAPVLIVPDCSTGTQPGPPGRRLAGRRRRATRSAPPWPRSRAPAD